MEHIKFAMTLGQIAARAKFAEDEKHRDSSLHNKLLLAGGAGGAGLADTSSELSKHNPMYQNLLNRLSGFLGQK